MAALWEQRKRVIDTLEKLICRENDGISPRSLEYHAFDALIFSGGTLRIWIDGVMYEAEIRRPVVQFPSPIDEIEAKTAENRTKTLTIEQFQREYQGEFMPGEGPNGR